MLQGREVGREERTYAEPVRHVSESETAGGERQRT
jgi:hypothetical protein